MIISNTFTQKFSLTKKRSFDTRNNFSTIDQTSELFTERPPNDAERSLSTTATRFALYARGTTRNARSALSAPRGLKLERRARTHGALPRTQGTEGTERKGLDTREIKNIR